MTAWERRQVSAFLFCLVWAAKKQDTHRLIRFDPLQLHWEFSPSPRALPRELFCLIGSFPLPARCQRELISAATLWNPCKSEEADLYLVTLIQRHYHGHLVSQ